MHALARMSPDASHDQGPTRVAEVHVFQPHSHASTVLPWLRMAAPCKAVVAAAAAAGPAFWLMCVAEKSRSQLIMHTACMPVAPAWQSLQMPAGLAAGPGDGQTLPLCSAAGTGEGHGSVQQGPCCLRAQSEPGQDQHSMGAMSMSSIYGQV